MRDEAGGEQDIEYDIGKRGTPNELRYKVAVRFVIEGDLRFISHHDTMRLFERALARAELPVRFSAGFNPKPKLSLPLPRPVGVASGVELLVVELREPLEPPVILERLGRQMPAGLRLTESWVLTDRHAPQADRVEYALAVPAEAAGPLDQAVQELLQAERWPVKRADPGGRPPRTLDLRKYLVDVSVAPSALRWTVQVTGAGSVRVAELLIALGLAPEQWQHRVRRTAVHWLNQAPAG